MKQTLLRRNGFWLILSLVLLLISGLGSALVQTAGGAVNMKTLTWETPSGKTQSAFLFVPVSASADDKRPAVVLSHGYNNQKQMQDNNYVELAKRGYVVMSIDRYSQGSSTINERTEVDTTATGTYEAVQLLATLPYVDASRIGVSGHSAGCGASTSAVVLDNAADEQLIAAWYGVDCDPSYVDESGEYANVYGSRDAGVFADQYDEFFFRSYDAEGNSTSAPRDYIDGDSAQSFLNFGKEKSQWEERDSYTVYTEDVDGREAIREIDNAPEIHPWATFSSDEARDLVAFYDKAFGSPNPIDPSSQTWQLKAAFNGLGLVGLAMFLVAFAKALLSVRFFSALAAEAPPATPLAGGRKGAAWFWGGLLVSMIFSGASFLAMASSDWGSSFAFSGTPGFSPQGPTSFIGIWAALNGVFALIVMTVSYFAFGKRHGVDLRTVGVFPGWRKFWLGILLAVIVVVAAVVLLFLSEYFFQSDWRFYVVAITTIGADRLWMVFFYLPLYLVFYVFNSVAVNSFNRFTIGGREWGNTALLAVANALPSIIIVVAQYSVFAINGELLWGDGFMGMGGIWLQFVIPYLIVTVIITRKIYRSTLNPYIGGFIMAAIATFASVSTSYTMAG